MTTRQASRCRLYAIATVVLIGSIRCGGPLDRPEGRTVHVDVGKNYEVEIDPIDTSRIELFYVCGNEFNVRNANPFTFLVHWKVQNTTDEGTVVIPPPPPGKAKSETHFVTKATGTVYLYYGNVNVRRYANQHIPCASPPPPVNPPPPPPPPPPSPTASGNSWTGRRRPACSSATRRSTAFEPAKNAQSHPSPPAGADRGRATTPTRSSSAPPPTKSSCPPPTAPP